MNTFRNSGYERKERDFYPTPECYVKWLFDHWKPDGCEIYEPCCGDGAMVRAFKKYAPEYDIISSDIDQGDDFLDCEDDIDCIITNPPYDKKICEKLIRHAIKQADQVAMLLRFDWDAAGKRSDMFGVDSFMRMKIVCNQRVPWEPGTKNGGQHNYAWIIWDRGWFGKEPLIRYAPK